MQKHNQHSTASKWREDLKQCFHRTESTRMQNKRTGSDRKEYEFASEMNEKFGNCHSTNPTFVVESSSTSTFNP